MQPTDQLEDSDTPQILAIQDVPYEDQGWLVLDVTKAVKSWQYDYKTNQGLVLNVVDANGNPVLPKDAGLNTTRYIHNTIDNLTKIWLNCEKFLFSDILNPIKSLFLRRISRLQLIT